ncbi:MAG: archease [Nanoarchaeota archaeon]
MKTFEYLEHTADAKFRAYGKNLDEAFSNTALAFFNLLIDTNTIKPLATQKINIQTKNKESLLFDFVDELVYLLSAEGFLLHQVSELTITKNNEGYGLSATLLGDDHKKYDTHGDIKAATYSDMLIEEKPEEVMIQMVVDV